MMPIMEEIVESGHCNPMEYALVAPDKGAVDRVQRWAEEYHLPLVRCLKHRDPETGKLSGFQLDAPYDLRGVNCLIIDDLCDGGGTFAGISELLKAAGAPWVGLAVTHGVFSKGPQIPGIDYIWTTNSYQDFPDDLVNFSVTPVPNPE
jgi:ribose-phosphate pyrophosphokinase